MPVWDWNLFLITADLCWRDEQSHSGWVWVCGTPALPGSSAVKQFCSAVPISIGVGKVQIHIVSQGIQDCHPCPRSLAHSWVQRCHGRELGCAKHLKAGAGTQQEECFTCSREGTLLLTHLRSHSPFMCACVVRIK